MLQSGFRHIEIDKRGNEPQIECFGSVTFWYGSGSAPFTGFGSGSGSCSFVSHLKTATTTKKISKFFVYYFFDETFASFSTNKKSK